MNHLLFKYLRRYKTPFTNKIIPVKVVTIKLYLLTSILKTGTAMLAVKIIAEEINDIIEIK